MALSSEQLLLRESPGSRTLLIAFADMDGGFGMRPGRFLDLIAPLPSHQLILTDPRHAWFLKGLPGIGDRPVEVARTLARWCRRLRAERVVTVGNSAGAYAAILFGALLEVDEIHAFGPQTRLTRFQDARRYPQHIGRLLRDSVEGPPFRDLAVLLRHLPHPGTRIFIHYARLDRLDRRRAERLRGIPSVTLIGRPVVGHELMRIYRQNGLLPKLLTSAVTGAPLNLRRETAAHVPGDFVRSLALRVRDIHRRRFKGRTPNPREPANRGGVLLVYPKGAPASELAPLGVPLLKGALRRQGVPVAAVDLQPSRARFRQGTLHLFNRVLSCLDPVWISRVKTGLTSLFERPLRRRWIRQQMRRLDSGRSINTIISEALEDLSPHPDLPRLHRLVRNHGITLVGFSVIYPGQLHHALVLARGLKVRFGAVHVLFGGAQVTKHLRFLIHEHDLSGIADGLVVKQGEHALRAYYEQMKGNGDRDAVPNLYYPDEAGVFRKSRGLPAPVSTEDILADFNDFRFAVLPLRASVGCAWGKCTFCTYSLFHDGHEAGRAGSLARAMAFHQRTCKASYFRIIDDFLTPAFLGAFSAAVIRTGLNVRWWAFMALVPGLTAEKASLMKQAGCLSVETGLESMSPRILRLMGKPHTPKLAQAIFEVLHGAGIDIYVDVMFGFPTETESDARQTLEYLLANRHLFKSINIQPFCLEEGTDVYRRPRTYGIERIQTGDKRLGVRKGFPFTASSGMSPGECRRFVEHAIQALS